MINFITSKTRRQGRVLIALALAIAALVWLLSTWSGLPTVEAREPAVANTTNPDILLSSSKTLTYFVFLPIVLSPPDLVFYDDFSDDDSGWPDDVSFEDCDYEYRDGRYRIKISGYGQTCMAPNFSIPEQINGTFSVKVRRISDSNRKLWYGFIFGAGSDANEERWELLVYPFKDSQCDNKGVFWLRAFEDGDEEFFEDRCTDAIDTDTSDWNNLKVIRNGKDIKVYINGQLKGDYDDADYLLDKGYHLLYATSASNDNVYIEFDNFEIRRSTSIP